MMFNHNEYDENVQYGSNSVCARSINQLTIKTTGKVRWEIVNKRRCLELLDEG